MLLIASGPQQNARLAVQYGSALHRHAFEQCALWHAALALECGSFPTPPGQVLPLSLGELARLPSSQVCRVCASTARTVRPPGQQSWPAGKRRRAAALQTPTVPVGATSGKVQAVTPSGTLSSKPFRRAALALQCGSRLPLWSGQLAGRMLLRTSGHLAGAPDGV
jgi:hypothetical protein